MDPLLHELLGTNGNEYPTTNKTEDEIKRLTLEEDMPEVKRATHILYRGQSIQKPSVYCNLYRILLEPDAFSKVMPLVFEGILIQSEEVQIEAGRGIIKLMTHHELDESQLLEILRLTMTVATLWNQPVLDMWVLVFHELLKKMSYATIAGYCETSIVSLSDQSQHPLSKYIAARMIGFIAEENIKPTEPLFDRARFLCQDPEVEVRKVIVQEVIVKICRSVGVSLTENKYLEKILELTYDSDPGVKLAAIDSLVEAMDMLSPGYKRTKMVPVMIELMNSSNEEVVKKMSFLIGKIIYKLDKIIFSSPTILEQFQDIIKEWTSQKDFEIRRNIVYNIPYLIRAMPNKETLKDIYIKAAKDSNLEVRIIAMSSFNEIVKSFDTKEAQTSFRSIFDSIFKEEEVEILEKVVPQLKELLAIFHTTVEDESGDDSCKNKEKDDTGKSKGSSKAKAIKEWKDWNSASATDIDRSKESTKVWSKESIDQRSCLEDLVSIGSYLNFKHAWRLEVVFIETMNKCMEMFDLKEQADVYIDYLIKSAAKSVKEVRRYSLDSIVMYLAKNHYLNKTNEIMKKVTNEFYNAKTFQGRLAFLEFYEKCAGQFSRQFFKTYNLNEMALVLGDDKVTEIKKKFLENAVMFKKMISEQDRDMAVKLEGVISRNTKNNNRYVAQLANETMKNIKFLTAGFFEEFNKEDVERLQKEEALKEKEKQEYELIKKRQEEELIKGRTENFNALTSLLFGGRKGGIKRSTWNEIYTLKLSKNTQSSIVCLPETPKNNKYIPPLLSLPTLNKHPKSTPMATSHLSHKETVESKPPVMKPRVSKHLVAPIEPVVTKKKAGSFSIQSKEKIPNLAAMKDNSIGERKSTKEGSTLLETPVRQVPEMKSSKLVQLKELRKEYKDGVRVPTIRKKNL